MDTNTHVLRIDLNDAANITDAIAQVCDSELKSGYQLRSCFVWVTNLVLIFQKVSA